MKIFNDFDVYKYTYNYDEMKVMCVIGQIDKISGLDYEELMCVAEAVYYHWVNNNDLEEEVFAAYPWLKIKDLEEEGYIQAYAYRVLPEFFNLYKEEK